MARLRLLHWKLAEAEPLLQSLRKAGHEVEYEEQYRTGLLREWRKSPPDAFVIDLSRLPSQGKEIAIALRQSPSTRRTPLVFCQGQEQKVANLKALIPEAAYCDLAALTAAVQTALQTSPADGPLPAAMMDRYGARTTVQKLGIREGSKVALLEPPLHVETLLGDLPRAVEFVEDEADVTLCFLHEPDALRRAFSDLRERAGKTRLWMLWRKKTSPAHRGITEPAVRETGSAVGLVDYKICSVDKNWSAMLFACKRLS